MTDRNAIIKAIWVHLVTEGGRWVPREVSAALPRLGHVHMSATLIHMYRAGMAARFPVPGQIERYAYGVTRDNRIPASLTVAELLSMRLAAESDNSGCAQ